MYRLMFPTEASSVLTQAYDGALRQATALFWHHPSKSIQIKCTQRSLLTMASGRLIRKDKVHKHESCSGLAIQDMQEIRSAVELLMRICGNAVNKNEDC